MNNIENKFFKGLPIYFANLDRSPERYEKLINDFKKYGINEFTRVSAIDGRQLDGPPTIYYPEHCIHHLETYPYGHFAIFATYLKMMQEFLKTDYEYGLFCDDDIDFYNSTKMDFNFYETLEYYNPEFYNVRVSIMHWEYYDSDPIVPGKMQRPGYLVVGQASIFNRKWVEKFLDKYNPSNQQVDNNFILDARAHSTKYFTPMPGIVAIDVEVDDEYAMVMPLFKHIVYNESLCDPHYNEDEVKGIANNHNNMFL